MAKKITVKVECTDCSGTGLYVGWTCHDGAAQICSKCKGSGAIEISYTPFTTRKKREGIKRVFPATPWTHLYADDHDYVRYSQYGCTLEEWENGVEPKPVEI